ncbi:MAG TPA: hypothetical protein VFZ34_02780 [Blastocatellia bacterium]|nr:hypothetical protein [Blastocatellia bacterium]
MTFILKAVAILLIFAFVVYVLKMISRLSFNVRNTAKELNRMREQATARQPKSTEMSRCVACGSFVAARDAVTVSAGGRAQIFCSTECLQSRVKTA